MPQTMILYNKEDVQNLFDDVAEKCFFDEKENLSTLIQKIKPLTREDREATAERISSMKNGIAQSCLKHFPFVVDNEESRNNIFGFIHDMDSGSLMPFKVVEYVQITLRQRARKYNDMWETLSVQFRVFGHKRNAEQRKAHEPSITKTVDSEAQLEAEFGPEILKWDFLEESNINKIEDAVEPVDSFDDCLVLLDSISKILKEENEDILSGSEQKVDDDGITPLVAGVEEMTATTFGNMLFDAAHDARNKPEDETPEESLRMTKQIEEGRARWNKRIEDQQDDQNPLDSEKNWLLARFEVLAAWILGSSKYDYEESDEKSG